MLASSSRTVRSFTRFYCLQPQPGKSKLFRGLKIKLGYFLPALKHFALPLYRSEEQLAAEEIRFSVNRIASNGGLSAAIMGGVSIASILTLQHRIPGADVSPLLVFAQDYVTPLYITSFFCNLQLLMTTSLVSGHVGAMPLELLPAWSKQFVWTLGICGWLQAPAVALLGAAFVCHAGVLFGEGIMKYALALYVMVGVTTCLQTWMLNCANIHLRDVLAEHRTKYNSEMQKHRQNKLSQFKEKD